MKALFIIFFSMIFTINAYSYENLEGQAIICDSLDKSKVTINIIKKLSSTGIFTDQYIIRGEVAVFDTKISPFTSVLKVKQLMLKAYNAVEFFSHLNMLNKVRMRLIKDTLYPEDFPVKFGGMLVRSGGTNSKITCRFKI